MAEAAFIDLLRAFATHPAARALRDDAAVLEVGGVQLVLTHDMIVEGVHFLPGDPPQDVAWKAVAVNLSDLAAKAVKPAGILLGFTLGDNNWDRAFAEGLQAVLSRYDVPLLGGDTVASPSGPRTIGVTALGVAPGPVPSRSGAKAGDDLWVTGTIGDAGLGLAQLRSGDMAETLAAARYRRPEPRLVVGQALGPLVSAMMDVSDGLLIDAARLGEASGCAIEIDLAAVPLGDAGADLAARLAAATAGDDYELLFTAAPDSADAVRAACGATAVTRIGRVAPGTGLTLSHGGKPVPLPARLGYLHGA